MTFPLFSLYRVCFNMPLRNAYPEIWLIRHGETEWSLSGQHTGRTDLPLTVAGEQRAREIGRFLAGRPFALVLTSPLTRARETCRLAGYGEVAQIEPDLREWDYGDYEGLTSEQIQKSVPGWTIWTAPVPHGETIQQVAARASRVIERASGAGGDVALFAHGHLLRILTACWLGIAPDGGRFFALSAGSLSVLGHEHETRVISQWNLRAGGA
ncbi:MAG TPA: histidine phosphatase family protein [Bryobacteraceae bacterium]|nr:histidine phosphatase family protein [Bryobacteraceae bacterium]